MRASIGSSSRVCHHERKAMGGERVVQLAWHHGRTANGVRWITGTEFFICEHECLGAAGLEKQDTGNKTLCCVNSIHLMCIQVTRAGIPVSRRVFTCTCCLHYNKQLQNYCYMGRRQVVVCSICGRSLSFSDLYRMTDK